MSEQDVRSYVWDKVETLPRPDMEKLQVERLQAEIDRVSKTVPFYKSKLNETGVTADSNRTRDHTRLMREKCACGRTTVRTRSGFFNVTR